MKMQSWWTKQEACLHRARRWKCIVGWGKASHKDENLHVPNSAVP